MTNETEFKLFYTQIEDGSWLAASISTPWFCLSAPTEEEVQAKALRALKFWADNRNARIQQSLERSVTPFAPHRVQSVRAAELCD
jgi:hypothetical protein